MGLTTCFTMVYGTLLGAMTVYIKTMDNGTFLGNEVTQNCPTIKLPEDDLLKVKYIFGSLKSILITKLKDSKTSTKKLEKLDPFSWISSSRKSSLLQQQFIMHQEMKEMLRKIERFSYDERPNYDLSNFQKTGYNISSSNNDLIGRKIINLPHKSKLRPTDCSELLVAGYTESGVYKIYPFQCHCTAPVKVYCDMDTDGGGWTVFLSRAMRTEAIKFNLGWNDYKTGFGDPEKEYWLGNDILHELTSSRNYMLRLEMEDKNGEYVWGEYDSFSVGSEGDKYKLEIKSFNPKSVSFDYLQNYDGLSFTTFDVDNIKEKKEGETCAKEHKGGWWYKDCHVVDNHTSVYETTKGTGGVRVMLWSKTDKETTHFFIWLQFKIRPKSCSDAISVVMLNKHNCKFN